MQLPPDMPEDKMDNRILKVCLGLQKDYPEEQTILVTKDMLLRIKAQMLSITAQDYTTDRIAKKEEQYSGRMEVYVEEEHFKELKKKRNQTGIYLSNGRRWDSSSSHAGDESVSVS